MTFSEQRAALATACESVGLTASGYITDDIQTPAAIIARATVDYDVTFGRGADSVNWLIRVYVDRADEIAGQDDLDEWVDPESSSLLKTAIEAASVATAGGVHYFRLRTASEVQAVTFGSITYLFIELTVEAVV